MIKLPNVFSFIVDNSVKIETKTLSLSAPTDQKYTICDVLSIHLDTIRYATKGTVLRVCHDLKLTQDEYICSQTFEKTFGDMIKGAITYKVFTR